MIHQYLSGVQQIGIGVKNAELAMQTYKELFGMDVLIFDDDAKAFLMSRYTGGTVFSRRAILTMNLQGGGGIEIWQYLDRVPKESPGIKWGDLGIYAAIIKSVNVKKTHERLGGIADISLSEMIECKESGPYFWVTDANKNTFKIITASDWFQKGKHDLGGVVGGVIGVSDMQKSLRFYQNVLGMDEILYDLNYSENNGEYRKVGLKKKATGKGAFNKLLGDVTIELIQLTNATAKKIYDNRFWGDCGFIHLCFDVMDMNSLKKHAEKHQCQFTVDSNNTFEMDNASGRFCYIEDPDGTLIELVETHKVPVFKKIGWYLDLRKRNQEKQLPEWIIKMLALSKVK
jgi:catechol 2,3-dioxygenase-like lactoylglutathione lyase family enzyme